MTDIILLSIMVLMILSVIVRIEQVRKTRNLYSAPSEVEHKVVVCSRSQYHIRAVVEMMASDKWELVEAHRTKNGNEIMFFTRKKIKTYYDDK